MTGEEFPSAKIAAIEEAPKISTMTTGQARESGGMNVAPDPTMHSIAAARCQTATTTKDMWWKIGADIT
jgi:hypothetical protein